MYLLNLGNQLVKKVSETVDLFVRKKRKLKDYVSEASDSDCGACLAYGVLRYHRILIGRYV